MVLVDPVVDKSKHLVVFELAGGLYALHAHEVREVIFPSPLSCMPGAPHYICGTMSHRHESLTVVCLRKRLGLLPAPSSLDSRILVTALMHSWLGLLVDCVTNVLRVQETRIEPPPTLVTRRRSVPYSGMLEYGDSLILLVDVARVLPCSYSALSQRSGDRGLLEGFACPVI